MKRKLTDFLSRLSKPSKYPIHLLNVAQFTGILNDNIFKLVVVFLLIGLQGREHASLILSITGALFVMPFLLFSSFAGILADRISKQRLLKILKLVEMGIMLLAMFAFSLKSSWASYTLLFLLATHSALFAPPKYAIISELVPKEKISSANGIITSFTYLGVIIGTFLASFATEITNRNFVAVSVFCFLIAVTGFISTLKIPPTRPQGSDKKLNLMFISQFSSILSFCRKQPHLLIAVFGSAYFLFIGAFAQLNMIPYTMENLHLNEITGGYLFLSIALGIAIGAYLGGRICKKKIELGLSCISLLFISIFSIFLYFSPFSLPITICTLLLLGISGGIFIVPCDSFMQVASPSEKRGQVIAANNFLSFCGVLLASIALYFFSHFTSPAGGFAIIGLITLTLSCYVIFRLSDLVFSFIAKILCRFKTISIDGYELIEQNPKAILFLKDASWKKAFLLLSILPNIHLLREKGECSFRIYRLFRSVHLIRGGFESLLEITKQLSSKGIQSCMMLANRFKQIDFASQMTQSKNFFNLKQTQAIFIDITFIAHRTIISFKTNK